MEERFERMQFTRDWRSASDFPTYEENEAQVRADLQALHEETKEYINERLLPEIESLAVPGTGDMKTEVYDPGGKREDVYRYAEARALESAEAAGDMVEEHARDLPHVDAWSKVESISPETREALGLSENATPDAALAKIAATPDIVMDVHTGKKYTVKAGVRRFGVKTAAAGNAGTCDGAAGLRCGDRLALWKVGSMTVIDAKTGALQASTNVGSLSAGRVRVLSTDGEVMAYANGGEYGCSMLDIRYCKSSGVVGLGTYPDDEYAWSNEGYWGWTNERSGYLYRGVRGSTALTRVTYSGGGNGALTPLCPLTFKGNDLYLLRHTGGSAFRITRLNVADGGLTEGVYTYDLGLTGGTPALQIALATDRYVWLALCYKWYDSGLYKHTGCRKLLRLDLETWELDMNGVTEGDFSADTAGNIGHAVQSSHAYIGTVGDKAYFWYDTTVYELDKETGALSWYSVPCSNTVKKLSNVREVVFDIPELPGVIVTGAMLFDTRTGEITQIPAADLYTVSSAGVPVVQERKVDRPISFGGTVTDALTLGFYGETTVIGGDAVWGVEALEEYTEPESDAGRKGEEA